MHHTKLTLLFLTASLTAFDPSRAGSQSTIASIVRDVAPSVVAISVRGTVQEEADPVLNNPSLQEFFGLQTNPAPSLHRFQTSGAGIVADGVRGYILTNHHVIENADEIAVTVPTGDTFPAKIVGVDPETDIAVVQIAAPSLKSIKFGDSSRVQVGDFVAAVGNPFGLGQTVTFGIVSALGRAGLGLDAHENFIQTDASLNPGNSGGPLVDMEGRLIGVNSAIVAPSGGNVGIGFAIPVSTAKIIMEKLIKDGAVHRGHLGVLVQDLTPNLARGLGVDVVRGALISQVIVGSTAATAGLTAGDVIVAIDDKPVETAATLRNLVGSDLPGQSVRLTVLRGPHALSLDVVLSKKDQSDTVVKKTKLNGEGALYGVVLGAPDSSNTTDYASRGAVVLSVDEDCDASAAGLEPGDIIVNVNRRDVRAPEQVLEALRRTEGILLLGIRHDGVFRFIAVPAS
ncbi:Do family serine endopeptidase [Agrobacterium tumefaciens]|uniref:Do family serine endopeptidase n=1 Tax=Agrobacterium tumefaciens TaxID=358 RepID=UPI0015730587|nr:Do family serine endopeptidase [Agrobacterium tumefaciens]WCK68715.1 Do family serine endopeptidase [Agrobacterium tumefaciens]